MLTWNSYYEIFKAQAKRLLPAAQYASTISADKQEQELAHLKNTLHYEHFFFVINYHAFAIQQPHGIHRWLGYHEAEFTVKKYYSIIHPAHLVAQMATGFELLESFIAGEWPVGFMSHSFINNIALQHANGSYILFKRIARPYQVDANHRLISILNDFTIIGPYNNEPYSSRLTNSFGEPIDLHQHLQKRSRNSLKKTSPFSDNENKLIELWATEPDLTTAAIAARFGVKDSTIITYKKRILEKAERLLQHRFKTAKEVALYLKEQGLVEGETKK